VGNHHNPIFKQEQEPCWIVRSAEPVRIVPRKKNADEKVGIVTITEVTRDVFRMAERQREYVVAGVHFR
jgi:hypothetical protein